MHHNTLRKQLDRERHGGARRTPGCKAKRKEANYDTAYGTGAAKHPASSVMPRAHPLIPLRQGSSAALLRAPPANCTMSALRLLLPHCHRTT